jgi:hypothetical protein
MFSRPKPPDTSTEKTIFFDENSRFINHLRRMQEKVIEDYGKSKKEIASNTNSTGQATNSTVQTTNSTLQNVNTTGQATNFSLQTAITTDTPYNLTKNDYAPKTALFSKDIEEKLFDEFVCAETKMKTFQTKYFHFNMSGQLGFPPEAYNFYFEIDNGVRKEIVALIEQNYFGSYSEIPLYSDAKLFLMNNDFNFKVKFTAQTDISIKIKIKYFESIFINSNYADSMIYDCRKAIKELNEFDENEKKIAR